MEINIDEYKDKEIRKETIYLSEISPYQSIKDCLKIKTNESA